MPISRYKSHAWNLIDDHKLVWDSDEHDSGEIIKREIEASSRLKIAMLDSEDTWNIHPVNLPMYFPDNETFQLKTSIDYYPKLIRSHDFASKMYDLLEGDFRDDENATYIIDAEGFPTFYSLCSDGSYYNYFDIVRSTTQNYKRLKVFSDGR